MHRGTGGEIANAPQNLVKNKSEQTHLEPASHQEEVRLTGERSLPELGGWGPIKYRAIPTMAPGDVPTREMSRSAWANRDRRDEEHCGSPKLPNGFARPHRHSTPRFPGR